MSSGYFFHWLNYRRPAMPSLAAEEYVENLPVGEKAIYFQHDDQALATSYQDPPRETLDRVAKTVFDTLNTLKSTRATLVLQIENIKMEAQALVTARETSIAEIDTTIRGLTKAIDVFSEEKYPKPQTEEEVKEAFFNSEVSSRVSKFVGEEPYVPLADSEVEFLGTMQRVDFSSAVITDKTPEYEGG